MMVWPKPEHLPNPHPPPYSGALGTWRAVERVLLCSVIWLGKGGSVMLRNQPTVCHTETKKGEPGNSDNCPNVPCTCSISGSPTPWLQRWNFWQLLVKGRRFLACIPLGVQVLVSQTLCAGRKAEVAGDHPTSCLQGGCPISALELRLEDKTPSWPPRTVGWVFLL